MELINASNACMKYDVRNSTTHIIVSIVAVACPGENVLPDEINRIMEVYVGRLAKRKRPAFL